MYIIFTYCIHSSSSHPVEVYVASSLKNKSLNFTQTDCDISLYGNKEKKEDKDCYYKQSTYSGLRIMNVAIYY